ncbi:MAG TPA: amino acid permease [Edaphocola sp.]|nr:amino acid permease [Edaphocola sp.]
MNRLFARKQVSQLLAEAGESEKGLKKTLSAIALISLGIGAIIGAGLFVQTANAAAHQAGPAVTIAFVIAALGCAFAGLCYAELSSSIPISGSAYTYTYATMGELAAWIIGWDLVLEYAVGAATVGIAWSEYLNNFLVEIMHAKPIPYEWCHSPFQVSKEGVRGIMNVPALGIVTAISFLLIRGIQESAFVNNLVVVLKVSIVLMLIIFGWSYINPLNHDPYIPEATVYVDHQGVLHQFGGWMGILGAAGTVFFAFIGFDAVSTAAQETKNPKTAMPIGIIGSLLICTLLYVLFAHVLTGLVPLEFFRDPARGGEASVSAAITEAMPDKSWLSKSVTVAILAGFSSVILVMLMGQSRVFYSMSRDGLLPAAFSQLHPKYKTPYKGNLIILLLVALFAAFVPGHVVGHMTSIGTLFAFSLVCIAVIVLRKKAPDLERKFKVPFVPVLPIIGVLICVAMMYGLGADNWLRLGVWLFIGFIIYFGYGRKHSKLNR